MKMLIPNEFAVCDDPRILDYIKRYPFATLMSCAAGELALVKIPLLLKADPAKPAFPLLLEGHMARINPLAKILADDPRLTIMFDGAHDYISANWYEDSVLNVPTWNYSTVILEAEAELISEQKWLEESVIELTREFEPDRSWEDGVDRKFLSKLSRGIVGIKATAHSAKAKFKLSQNKSSEDRQRVIEALEQRQSPISRALADDMKDLVR